MYKPVKKFQMSTQYYTMCIINKIFQLMTTGKKEAIRFKMYVNKYRL